MENIKASKHAIHLRRDNAFQVHHWDPCEKSSLHSCCPPPSQPLPGPALVGSCWGASAAFSPALLSALPLGLQLPQPSPALWLSGNVLWFSAGWLGGDHRISRKPLEPNGEPSAQVAAVTSVQQIKVALGFWETAFSSFFFFWQPLASSETAAGSCAESQQLESLWTLTWNPREINSTAPPAPLRDEPSQVHQSRAF